MPNAALMAESTFSAGDLGTGWNGLGESLSLGSGLAGSTPVAAPAAAPPTPPSLPEIAPSVALGGGVTGTAVGTSVGARRGAGVLERAGGFVDGVPAPLPTGPRGMAMYCNCS